MMSRAYSGISGGISYPARQWVTEGYETVVLYPVTRPQFNSIIFIVPNYDFR